MHSAPHHRDAAAFCVANLRHGAHIPPHSGRYAVVAAHDGSKPARAHHFGDAFGYTVSDGRGGSATANVSVNVTAVPGVHVGDIDAFTSKNAKNWSVRLRIYVDSQNEKPLQNVVVSGSWNTSLAQGCTTNRFAYCELSLVGISLAVPSRTFTITGLTLSGRTFLASSNDDPDAASDGTTIGVARP